MPLTIFSRAIIVVVMLTRVDNAFAQIIVIFIMHMSYFVLMNRTEIFKKKGQAYMMRVVEAGMLFVLGLQFLFAINDNGTYLFRTEMIALGWLAIIGNLVALTILCGFLLKESRALISEFYEEKLKKTVHPNANAEEERQKLRGPQEERENSEESNNNYVDQRRASQNGTEFNGQRVFSASGQNRPAQSRDAASRASRDRSSNPIASEESKQGGSSFKIRKQPSSNPAANYIQNEQDYNASEGGDLTLGQIDPVALNVRPKSRESNV